MPHGSRLADDRTYYYTNVRSSLESLEESRMRWEEMVSEIWIYVYK